MLSVMDKESGHRVISTSLFGTYHILVIFVYATADKHNLTTIYSWDMSKFVILNLVLIICAIILYLLRRLADIQRRNFMTGLLEMYCIAFNAGNIQCQHRLERIFFVIALIASFFLVSLYLAEFSLQSVIHESPHRIDTFEKLIQQNVTIYLASNMKRHKKETEEMLR